MKSRNQIECMSVRCYEPLLGESTDDQSDPAYVDAVIGLFRTIAAAEGWQPGDALSADRSNSVYFALHSSEAALVGGLQLVLPDSNGMLPSQRVWKEAMPEDSVGSAHIAVMAVDSPWRGGSFAIAPFWLLAVEMWRYCAAHRIAEVWLEATPRVLRLYQRIGFPLTIRGDLRRHWGEDCFLTSMRTRDVAGALAERAVRSATYRTILARAFRFPAA